MEYFPAPLEKLVEQFARLPGVGYKSAQRLAFYVLSLPEQEAQAFADAIMDAKRSVTLCPSAKLHLEVKASRTTLQEKDTYDMAAVRVRILDENGTPAPYAQFPVQFAVEGSAALVGPQTAVAEGGMTGTYLRTVGTAGEALLTVSAPQTQPVVLRFTIEKEDAVWN